MIVEPYCKCFIITGDEKKRNSWFVVIQYFMCIVMYILKQQVGVLLKQTVSVIKFMLWY